MEAELRHQQMGMGTLAPRLGIVSADVLTLAQPATQDAQPPKVQPAPLALIA
jgi:hypothetical protein